MARTKPLQDENLWNAIPEIASERETGLPLAAEDVAARIQELIVSQNLSEGTRLPSERDLAKMFGTSRPTVG